MYFPSHAAVSKVSCRIYDQCSNELLISVIKAYVIIYFERII